MKPKQQTKQPKPATFTYDEVKSILCDACRLGVPDTHSDTLGWTHWLNEQPVKCNANAWRQDKRAHK